MLLRLLLLLASISESPETFRFVAFALAIGLALLAGLISWLMARSWVRRANAAGLEFGTVWLALWTAHALLFWLVVCVDELSARHHSPWLTPGAGLLIAASIALLVVATGAGVSGRTRRLAAVLCGVVFAVVVGLVAALMLGAFDDYSVSVTGIKGWRGTERLAVFLDADTVFLRHGGHSAVVWRWILRVAAAHATLGLIASLRCFSPLLQFPGLIEGWRSPHDCYPPLIAPLVLLATPLGAGTLACVAPDWRQSSQLALPPKRRLARILLVVGGARFVRGETGNHEYATTGAAASGVP